MTAKHLQCGTDADKDEIVFALSALASDILEDDVYCEAYETTTSIDAEEAIEYEVLVAITATDESRFTDVFDHHAIEGT